MAHDFLSIAFMAALGLAIGSFLNVLIHRLPIMIEQSWQDPATTTEPAMDLAFPGSHCPACRHPIAWYDNLPVLGFVLLRGRCRHCQAPISWQYPLVELLTGALFVWSLLTHASWAAALAWAGFAAALLALAVIDARTTWLPDTLTQPLTWGGLIAAGMGWSSVSLQLALAGAVVGYLFLWSVYWAFRLLTGKEGMGYGDFKLLAAIGAWLGWALLPLVILLASLAGAVIGVAMIALRRHRRDVPMPFGPYLATAGAIALFWGPGIAQRWLPAIG